MNDAVIFNQEWNRTTTVCSLKDLQTTPSLVVLNKDEEWWRGSWRGEDFGENHLHNHWNGSLAQCNQTFDVWWRGGGVALCPTQETDDPCNQRFESWLWNQDAVRRSGQASPFLKKVCVLWTMNLFQRSWIAFERITTMTVGRSNDYERWWRCGRETGGGILSYQQSITTIFCIVMD